MGFPPIFGYFGSELGRISPKSGLSLGGGMSSVWGELKRRNVVKVAVAYAIVGWLLIEVSTTVLPLFEAPDWIAQVFTFFVILGFPWRSSSLGPTSSHLMA